MRWVITLVGVAAVLAFAAYLSLNSRPQPATGFKVSVSSGANHPATAARALQPASSPAASSHPVVEETRLPSPAPSIVRTASVRGTAGFGSRPRGGAQLHSAVASNSAEAPSQAAGGPATAQAPAVAEASTSGPGPDVASTNNPTPPAPTPPPATPAAAVLMPHGSILLNGKPATDSTALFPGDRIQVPPGAYASINGKGSLSVLQPGSSLVYTPQGLDLQQGGVAVSTLEGMPVSTEGLTVVPRAGHGKYDVLDDNGTVQVASLEGDLNIMDGGHASVLAQGQQTTLDKRKKAAAAPAAESASVPNTPPPTASGGFPTGKVLLIGGAVGGGVVAAILLTRSSSKPVSPAVP